MEMKTYSGELKDGMLCTDSVGSENIYFWEEHYTKLPAEVMINREWHEYKPQAKKVWGIPEVGQTYYSIQQYDRNWAAAECIASTDSNASAYLCKHTAEQHAKALNYINEFRALSDVPVDEVDQWIILSEKLVTSHATLQFKLSLAIFGVVFNTKEQAEHALAKFPRIHIANKIIQFGFHGGIVEERL